MLIQIFCLQCEKVAFEKYGGPEGIEEHRRGLLEVRQERRALKRATDRQRASCALANINTQSYID